MKKYSERHNRLSAFVGVSIGNDVPGTTIDLARRALVSQGGPAQLSLAAQGPPQPRRGEDIYEYNDSENDTVGRQRQASEVGGGHRWFMINGPAIGSTRPMC